MRKLFREADDSWPKEQVALMGEFEGATTAPREGYAGRIWQDKAILNLEYNDQSYLYLANFRAITPQKGHGKEALEWLKNLADRHNVMISLLPIPENMSKDALIKWYKRAGFEQDNGVSMRYTPKGPF